ncbi:MAG: hypothetical protein IJO94_00385 [Firmicutes bacterium]|nr:hypothetical protein [Bacillota bacterium]
MIKGIGKQIILMNNTESEIFEQAIFILRSQDKMPYKNIVKECERMMHSHIHPDRRQHSANGWRIAFFIALFCIVALLALYLLK